MRTRREAVLGGALTLLLASGPCVCAQRMSAGCLVSEEQAQRLLASSRLQAHLYGDETPIKSSGDRELDFAVAQTLAMLAETFDAVPGFAYYDDYDGMNALATSQRTLARSDGTVLFGTRLLRSFLGKAEHPEVSIATVCAHEFGHIVQFKRGLTRTLQGWETSVRRIELHADFLAGFFAGIRKLRRPSFPAVVFATTAFGIGDYHKGDPEHHGTPDERANAVVLGFLTAFRDRRTLTDAIDIGVKYVRST